MNYLQLTQRLHAILRIGQDNLGTAPTTVVSQTGMLSELAMFIAAAWEDIQNAQNHWLFMHKRGTLTLSQGVNEVAPTAISDYSELIVANSDRQGRFITIYGDNVSEETPVRYVPYQDWAYSYLQRGERGPGMPGNFTQLPDGTLQFDMVADRAYVLRLDYKRTTQTLVADSDTPIMPSKYHQLIVLWAIVHYYCLGRDGTNDLRTKSEISLKREMRHLLNQQLPEVLGFEIDP